MPTFEAEVTNTALRSSVIRNENFRFRFYVWNGIQTYEWEEISAAIVVRAKRKETQNAWICCVCRAELFVLLLIVTCAHQSIIYMWCSYYLTFLATQLNYQPAGKKIQNHKNQNVHVIERKEAIRRKSTYGSTALVDLGRFFSFLIYTLSVGLLGRRISPSQGRYLHTEQHNHRINAHRHPCLEWDSIPRPQCSRGRRRFMP
jgi:hypothetical protein